MSPAHADAHYRRAGVLVELEQTELALDDLEKAVDLDPDDIDPYLLLDYILSRRREFDAVIGYWNQFIERRPDQSRAYIERGGAYYRKGDYRSAVANAKIAADLGDALGKETYEKYKYLTE